MKIIKQLTLLRTYQVPGRAISTSIYCQGNPVTWMLLSFFIGETEAESLENVLKLPRMEHERARIKTQAICLQNLPS